MSDVSKQIVDVGSLQYSHQLKSSQGVAMAVKAASPDMPGEFPFQSVFKQGIQRLYVTNENTNDKTMAYAIEITPSVLTFVMDKDGSSKTFRWVYADDELYMNAEAAPDQYKVLFPKWMSQVYKDVNANRAEVKEVKGRV